MKPKNIQKKSTVTKESLFIKSFKLAKSNPSKTGLMILFDVLFLISIFALFRLSLFFSQGLAVPQTPSSIFIFIIFSLIYYSIVLFAYSFFKYCVLDSTKSLFDKTDFSFKRFGQFYSLNIIIAGIFFAILILFNFILAGIKQSYAPFVFIFLATPYLLFLYIIVNTAHPLFYEGALIKDSIKKSFNIAFTKIKNYREVILTIILFALLSWLLLSGSNYLFQKYAYRFSLANSEYIKQAYVIIFDAVSYLIILINRISFYAIIRENK